MDKSCVYTLPYVAHVAHELYHGLITNLIGVLHLEMCFSCSCVWFSCLHLAAVHPQGQEFIPCSCFQFCSIHSSPPPSLLSVHETKWKIEMIQLWWTRFLFTLRWIKYHFIVYEIRRVGICTVICVLQCSSTWWIKWIKTFNTKFK